MNHKAETLLSEPERPTLETARKLGLGPVETMRRMREGRDSLRWIAANFECSASTVLRTVQQGRVG